MAVLDGGYSDTVQWTVLQRDAFAVQAFPNVTVDLSGALSPLPNVSAAWLAAAGHSQAALGQQFGAHLVLAAHFVALNRLFSTDAIADALDLVPSLEDVELLLADLSRGGVSAINVDLDDTNDSVRLSGGALQFIDASTVLPTFTTSLLQNALVVLSAGYAGISFADYLPLFTGLVDRYTLRYGEDVNSLALSLIDQRLQQSMNLSTPIGQQYFPGVPARARGQNIPVLVGALIDIPLLPVLEGPATGTLLVPLEAAQTSLIVKEFGQPFPEAADLLVDAEMMSYTSRQLVNVEGVTGLQLAGLSRGAPVAHVSGAPVVRDNTAPYNDLSRHILGYGPVSVNEVRYMGTVLDPVYEYEVITLTADRDVTAIEVQFEPPDDEEHRLTASVNSPNLDTDEQIINGGFETGDATGWDASLNATVDISGTAPVPFAGLYRLGLTGEQNTDATFDQDLTLTAFERYDFTLRYRNEKAVSILDNHSFEADPVLLTDWTTANNVNALLRPQIGLASDGVQFAAASSFFPDSLLANHLLGSFPTGWTVTVDTGNTKLAVGTVAQGLTVRSAGIDFELTFYQDVTTEVGQTYAFAFKFVTVALSQFENSGTSDIAYRVGTPADDEAYIAEILTGQSHTYVGNFNTGTGLFNQPSIATAFIIPVGDYIPTQTFVAATTTTRVTFRMTGSHQSFVTLSDVQLRPMDALLLAPRAIRRYDHGLQLHIILNAQLNRNSAFYLPITLLSIFWSPQPGYRVRLSQDVPTTVGERYAFSFDYLTTRDQLTDGVASSSIRYAVGVPTNETAYLPWAETGASEERLQGRLAMGRLQLSRLTSLTRQVITATEATTRVVFELHGQLAMADGSFPYTQVPGVFAVVPPFIALDNVGLIAGTGPNQSRAALSIGIPFAEEVYVDELLPFSAEWTEFKGTFAPEQDAVRFRLRSQYSASVFASAFDMVSVRSAFSFSQNTGGTNPIDAMFYMLNTFKPGFTHNAESFAIARGLLADWQFGAYLTDPGDLDARLQRMAQQCASLLQRDPLGQYDITVLDNARPIVFDLTVLNIVDISMEPSSADRVYTSFNVYFAARTGGSTSAQDFGGITYANPTSSSHPNGGTLTSRCAEALAASGRDHRFDLFAEWIQDFATANLELEWLVNRYAIRPDVVTLTTFLDALPLRAGQLVRIEHPVLPQEGGPWLGEIVGRHFTPGSTLVELVISLTGLAPELVPLGEYDIMQRLSSLTLSHSLDTRGEAI